MVTLLTLYVGTRQDGARDKILALVRDAFESFTVIEGQGYYKGRPEPLWEIKVASDKPSLVFELAARLRGELDQEGIGIEHAGRFFRLTCSDSPEDCARNVLGPDASGQ